MNSYDHSGRTALVTGGASGIGAAVADKLREGGAKVYVFDRTESDDPLSFVGDVTSSQQVDAAVDQAGGVDILVHCAGVSGHSLRTTEVSDAEWERVIAINLSGSFFACRAVIPAMIERGWGRIILLASIAGKEGNPMAAAYSASKAGVIALAKAVGKDLATTGVLVHSVAPAVIETPMLADMSAEHRGYMVERIPMRRTGRPEEVAALISWLASGDCSFSTGASFDASGGRAVY